MAVLASDNFTRADNADIGVAWTPEQDSFKILSNKATSANPSTSDAAEGYTALTFPDNQWSEVTYGVVGTAGIGTGNGACVRAAAGVNYYRIIMSGAGYEFAKIVGGGFTSLGSSATPVVASGDRAYLEMQGQQPVCKTNSTNGVGGTPFGSFATDASLASGVAGVAYSAIDATPVTLSNWVGGDFISSNAFRRRGRPFPFKPGSSKFVSGRIF